MAKKSGRTELRMTPELHRRVARTAESLQMSMNALINIALQSVIVQFEDLVRVFQQSGGETLFAQWRELNPTRSPQLFYRDLFAMGWSPEPQAIVQRVSIRFEDGELYTLSRDEQCFIWIQPGGLDVAEK
jgi:hypothetical protein